MGEVRTIAKKIGSKGVGVCLASGFFGFYHQTGVIKALEENGIRPVRVTGTSAGALTASLYAAGASPEEIRDILVSLRRQDFWDVHWPLTKSGAGLLAGHRFKAELGRVLKVHSFEECSIPLSVGVYNLDEGRVEHISRGPLIEAVYASCAYPYLFTPSLLGGGRYWDGGFGEKCPLIPFLDDPKVSTVIVSYIPRRNRQHKLPGILGLAPPLSSLFADTPKEERIERDRVSVEVLRKNGKQVFVLAPPRLRLGPFSMHKGQEGYTKGYEGAMQILGSSDETLLGAHDLT